ncbi:hypothetical protein [Bacteroides sp.]|uniref:hypothetical protein n=1 Tax=Bacteroides sp. TaxID=29523 RepID=UPI0025B93AE2|nr:hypothetical protein [Bacteroides sp.]
MRKVVLLTTFAVAALAANAQVLKNEFLKDYKPGDKLEKGIYQSPTEPINVNTWNGAFDEKRVAEIPSPVVVEGLSYAGYPEGGLAISLGGFPNDIKGSSTCVYSLTENKNEFRKGVCYLAFLVNLKKTGGGFSELVGMTVNHTGGNRGKVYVKRNEERKITFGVGARKIGAESKSYDFNKTHLLVLKMDFAKQEMSLFINPELTAGEPAPELVAKAEPGEIKNAIKGIYYRHRRGCDGAIGNFRFSNNWVTVIGK